MIRVDSRLPESSDFLSALISANQRQKFPILIREHSRQFAAQSFSLTAGKSAERVPASV